MSSSLVNYPQYIHFEIYSFVLSFVIVISSCHNIRRYIAKLLYGWDDGKFEAEYLRKLEKNW